MADAITIKALQDASLDAKSLEEVVNGNAVTTVLSRLGETYPTLSNALNQIDSKLDSADAQIKQGITNLFENGGLPATPFTTKALMTASALVDGKYAMVTDDTVNNGLYVKTAGAWVKSTYDPLTQANSHTDTALSEATTTINTNVNTAIKNIATTTVGDELFKWADATGNVVAEIKGDAGLYLAGFDGEVQETLTKSNEIGNAWKVSGNIDNLAHAFADNNDNILAGIDNESGLRLEGSVGTVQDSLGYNESIVSQDSIDERLFFTPECDKYFMNLVATGRRNPPVGYGLLPQRYTVPDTIINSFTLTPPTEYIPLDTPYGINDKVVHPYVIELPATLRGYRYLMCITPYATNVNENPVIYGSKDSDNWVMLPDMPQPLMSPEPDEFLSDNGLTYDPVNGLLVCYWRRSDLADSGNSMLYYRATRDGINWTDRKTLKSAEEGQSFISPSVLFNPNDGLWHLWTYTRSGYIQHLTSKNLNNDWDYVSEQALSGLWHFEVKYIGDKYILVNNKRDPDSNFLLAISSDGNTWVQGKKLFEAPMDALYKASVIPKLVGNNLHLEIYYTTNHAVNPLWHRRFFKVTSNTITI